MKELRRTANRTTIRTRGCDEITYAEFPVWKFKPIVGEIDRLLGSHHGFTDEELDPTPSTRLRTGINHDMKYRLGQDCAEEADE